MYLIAFCVNKRVIESTKMRPLSANVYTLALHVEKIAVHSSKRGIFFLSPDLNNFSIEIELLVDFVCLSHVVSSSNRRQIKMDFIRFE